MEQLTEIIPKQEGHPSLFVFNACERVAFEWWELLRKYKNNSKYYKIRWWIFFSHFLYYKNSRAINFHQTTSSLNLDLDSSPSSGLSPNNSASYHGSVTTTPLVITLFPIPQLNHTAMSLAPLDWKVIGGTLKSFSLDCFLIFPAVATSEWSWGVRNETWTVAMVSIWPNTVRAAGYVSGGFSGGVPGVTPVDGGSARGAGILCRLKNGYVPCATKRGKSFFKYFNYFAFA